MMIYFHVKQMKKGPGMRASQVEKTENLEMHITQLEYFAWMSLQNAMSNIIAI